MILKVKNLGQGSNFENIPRRLKMKHHIQIRYFRSHWWTLQRGQYAYNWFRFSQQNGLGTSHLHWNKDAVSKTVFNITVSTTVLELHDFVSYAAFEFCFVTSSPVYMCQNFPPKKKFLQMIWEHLIYIIVRYWPAWFQNCFRFCCIFIGLIFRSKPLRY